MKIRILPSSVREPSRLHYLTTFLVNGEAAIDAGCLGAYGTPAEQTRMRDVFLTHSHADHTAALPIFLGNVIEEGLDEPSVHGPRSTLESLQQDVFNGRVWPDFVGLRLDERVDLARRSGHLTPATFAREVEKLGLRDVAILAFHLKPRWRERIVEQLSALRLPDVQVAELGRDYVF
jgi:cAMP phosphodiesterase